MKLNKLMKKAEKMENMEMEEMMEEKAPDVRSLCEDVTEKILGELYSGKYEPGTKEYEALVKALSELNKLRTDAYKSEADQHDKEIRFDEDKKHWRIDTLLKVAQLLASTGLTLIGFMGTFSYEEGHNISTKVFTWVQRIVPKMGRN